MVLQFVYSLGNRHLLSFPCRTNNVSLTGSASWHPFKQSVEFSKNEQFLSNHFTYWESFLRRCTSLTWMHTSVLHVRSSPKKKTRARYALIVAIIETLQVALFAKRNWTLMLQIAEWHWWNLCKKLFRWPAFDGSCFVFHWPHHKYEAKCFLS